MNAIDAWLAGDGDEVELVEALAEGSARRELVELALIDVLLPRSAPPPRPAVRARRVAAVAAVVVAVAMIVALWLRPRDMDVPASPHVIVTLEPGSRAMTVEDRTTLYEGGIAVRAPDDGVRTIDTPIGSVALMPGTRATLRASSAPAALYVEVSAGQATVTGEILRSGQRGTYGDRIAGRRLGPRVVVTILRIDGARLEARLPSGTTQNFLLSQTVEISGALSRGDRAELILAPNENEVFVIAPYSPGRTP